MNKLKLAIFIDGSNFYHNLKRVSISNLDFEKFIKLLSKNTFVVKTFYYNAALDISFDKKKY